MTHPPSDRDPLEEARDHGDLDVVLREHFRVAVPASLQGRIAELVADERARGDRRSDGLTLPRASNPLYDRVATKEEDDMTAPPLAPAVRPALHSVLTGHRPGSFLSGPVRQRPSGPLGVVATLVLVLLTVASGLGILLTLPEGGGTDEPTTLPAAGRNDRTPAMAHGAGSATPVPTGTALLGTTSDGVVTLPPGAEERASTGYAVEFSAETEALSVSLNRYDLLPNATLNLSFSDLMESVSVLALVEEGTAEIAFTSQSPIHLPEGAGETGFVTLTGTDRLSVEAGPEGATLYLLTPVTSQTTDVIGAAAEMRGGGYLSILGAFGQFGAGATDPDGTTWVSLGSAGSIQISARLVVLSGLSIESGRQVVLGGDQTLTMVTPLDTGIQITPLRGTTSVSYNLVNVRDYDPDASDPRMLAPGTGATVHPGSRARLDGSTLPVTLLVIEVMPIEIMPSTGTLSEASPTTGTPVAAT